MGLAVGGVLVPGAEEERPTVRLSLHAELVVLVTGTVGGRLNHNLTTLTDGRHRVGEDLILVVVVGKL